MTLKKVCLLLLWVTVTVSVQSRDRNRKPYKVVCYLGSWANYREGDGKFLIENIDPKLCTHIIYAFAKLDNNRITSYDSYLDLKNPGLGAYQRFNSLKRSNPQLTTLIAIGGWSVESIKFSSVAATANARAIFVKSAVDFCLKHNFDGLDMDWEYPANEGGAPADKKNFVLLLEELKQAFIPHGLLLSAAVSASKQTIDTAYDIPGIVKYVDFINVMAYDFHGSWENTTGHNAPLYERPGDPNRSLSVDYAIKYWIRNGAPRRKIVLGMGTYGRTFTLVNEANNGLKAAANGSGRAGPLTREAGTLGYNEICRDRNWNTVWAKNVEAPYAYKGNQWVGYDNIKSIGIKTDYVIRNNLGGGMIWSLETDDFRGNCVWGKYPLLSTIATKLNSNTVKQPQTTRRPGQGFQCSIKRITSSIRRPIPRPFTAILKTNTRAIINAPSTRVQIRDSTKPSVLATRTKSSRFQARLVCSMQN